MLDVYNGDSLHAATVVAEAQAVLDQVEPGESVESLQPEIAQDPDTRVQLGATDDGSPFRLACILITHT